MDLSSLTGQASEKSQTNVQGAAWGHSPERKLNANHRHPEGEQTPEFWGSSHRHPNQGTQSPTVGPEAHNSLLVRKRT